MTPSPTAAAVSSDTAAAALSEPEAAEPGIAAPGIAEPGQTESVRQEAVRGLEGAFSELMEQFRRFYAAAAHKASPGMLPGTFKVLAMVSRRGPITLSALAEHIVADKGMISRHISELEDLTLVERTAAPDDRRVRLVAITDKGRERLEAARAPYEGHLFTVLQGWPVDSIDLLTELLHALAIGEVPAD